MEAPRNLPFTVNFRGNIPSPPRRRGWRYNPIRPAAQNISPTLRAGLRNTRTGPSPASRALAAAPTISVGVANTFEQALRRARIDNERLIYNPPPRLRVPGETHVRPARSRPPRGRGAREIRERPLEREDLWVDGVGPTSLLPSKPFHKCTLCEGVKSHPVSYLCGHSHCYVCIRLRLEHHWNCPDCSSEMYHAPFRQYAEEAALEDEYPGWDESTVAYSWSGLVFPKEPRIIIIPDSP
ncbi:hypothetical protein B0H15DRAFT_945776 [Mycena belliarum]|uniref:RING-type domain-containing protein n=1 Tax=Mycena belliarum TaxID=1033014 RepID=A0AAD6UBK8_9AGAR|nr:hypothetical protein B0H15DRAFT_945776 [Mycena belliae]